MSEPKEEKAAPKKKAPVANAALRAILSDLLNVSALDPQDRRRHLETLNPKADDNAD